MKIGNKSVDMCDKFYYVTVPIVCDLFTSTLQNNGASGVTD